MEIAAVNGLTVLANVDLATVGQLVVIAAVLVLLVWRLGRGGGT